MFGELLKMPVGMIQDTRLVTRCTISELVFSKETHETCPTYSENKKENISQHVIK